MTPQEQETQIAIPKRRYTKGPWATHENTSIIKGGDGYEIAFCNCRFVHYDVRKANADRIVECVNAFEGIDDPSKFIDILVKRMSDQIREIALLRTEIKKMKISNEPI